MSFRDIQQHLEDIRDNILLVEQFAAGRSFADYQSDILLRSAVERRLQIITEAAYRLGDEASQVDPGHDWKNLRGLGNILRHAYQRVDDSIIWLVVTRDLPKLKVSVSEALKKYD